MKKARCLDIICAEGFHTVVFKGKDGNPTIAIVPYGGEMGTTSVPLDMDLLAKGYTARVVRKK